MAESHKDNEKRRKKQNPKTDPPDLKCNGEGEGIPECAVCLQTCVHPARLPCSHIFCFLCLKGLVTQSRRCAMCRQDIPTDYLDHPQLLEFPNNPDKDVLEDGYQWFYEGRSGWWQYDERTSRELETAYKNGHRTCELLIAGQLYIADFDAMLQLRRNDLSRRRRIKRDLASIPKKGIAGLRFDCPPQVAVVSDSNDSASLPSSSALTVMSVPLSSSPSRSVSDRHSRGLPEESLVVEVPERRDFVPSTFIHNYRIASYDSDDYTEDQLDQPQLLINEINSVLLEPDIYEIPQWREVPRENMPDSLDDYDDDDDVPAIERLHID